MPSTVDNLLDRSHHWPEIGTMTTYRQGTQYVLSKHPAGSRTASTRRAVTHEQRAGRGWRGNLSPLPCGHASCFRPRRGKQEGQNEARSHTPLSVTRSSVRGFCVLALKEPLTHESLSGKLLTVLSISGRDPEPQPSWPPGEREEGAGSSLLGPGRALR